MRSEVRIKIFKNSSIAHLEKEVNNFILEHNIVVENIFTTHMKDEIVITITYID